jgi:AAHS family 3-hydroxyphenylpropionic acid transporter
MVLCFLGALIEGFDIQSAGITAHKVAVFYGLDSAHMGFVFSANTLGLFLGAITGGLIADRIGRKRVLVASFLVVGFCSLGTAFARSGGEFTLMRLLTGIGLGGSVANLIAIVAELGHERSRATRVTVMSSGIAFGGMAVSLLAVALPPAFDWRLIFMVGGSVPLLLAALFAAALRRSDVRSTAANISPVTLFRRGQATTTLCLWAASFATLLTLHLLLNWLPVLLMSLGHTARLSALVSVAFSLGGGIGAIVLGLLIRRRGPKAVFIVTYLGIVGGLLALMAFARLDSGALAGGFATGFFVMGAQLMIYGLVPVLYQADSLSTAIGFTVAAGRLGSIAGPLVAGLILGAGHSPVVVFGAMLPLLAAALISMVGALSANRQ